MGSKTQFQKWNRTESNEWGAITPARSGPHCGLEAGCAGPSRAETLTVRWGTRARPSGLKTHGFQSSKQKEKQGEGETAVFTEHHLGAELPLYFM